MRSLRLILLMTVTLALALAACASGPTGRSSGGGESTTPVCAPPPIPTWKYEDALDRGVKFILDTQKADGGWGDVLPWRPGDIYIGGFNSLFAFGNASSSLCCMALLAQPSTPAIDAALARGYRHLVNAPDAVRIQMDTFYDVWAHAYMNAALARGLKDVRLKDQHEDFRQRIKLELRRTYQLQALDGGWGYFDFDVGTLTPSGGLSTTFTTAAVLVGLKELQDAGVEVDQRTVTRGLDYLERLRIPNGAYCYSSGHLLHPLYKPNMIRGSIGRAEGADHALFIWGRTLKATDVKDAMDRFFKEHIFIEIGRGREWPHEAWYATAPYYYYYGHYYASKNLSVIPKEYRAPYALKLSDIIAQTQYDDGSFWDYPLFGYTKAYGTGYAVLTLTYCKHHLE